MSATFVIRGITPHTFANEGERNKFLQGVKLDPETGLLVKGSDYAKFAGAVGGMLADTKLTPLFVQAIVSGSMQRDEADAIEAAQDRVEIIPCRNGQGYNLYRGPQGDRTFVVYISAETVASVHAQSETLAAYKANGTIRYYESRPEYPITRGARKGETQAAEPAVVVQVKAGGLAVSTLAEGAAADDYAKQHNLTPVNNPPPKPKS